MSNPYEGLLFPVKAAAVAEAGAGCRVRHPLGQTWLLKGVPPGICSFAFNAMFPAYGTLLFGGSDPYEAEPGQMHVTCQAAGCGARFQVQRISDEEAATLEQAARLITLEDLAKTIPAGLSKRLK